MSERHVFDGKRDCAYCGGVGTVPVPATNTEPPTVEKCECCGGTGLCEAARLAKLEEELARVTAALAELTKREDYHYRKMYAETMALWGEA